MIKGLSNYQDPQDDPLFQPVEEKSLYTTIGELLDDRHLKFTSYIKDDNDRGRIMHIKTQLRIYRSLMEPLAQYDPIIKRDMLDVIAIYEQQLIDYLEGMLIRKGWRPEQITAILSGIQKQKKMAGFFEDNQMKGVEDIKRFAP